MPRMYTFDDVNSLLKDFRNDEKYLWKMETAKKANGKTLGYYILGLPV